MAEIDSIPLLKPVTGMEEVVVSRR